jgi:hypothetical protein
MLPAFSAGMVQGATAEFGDELAGLHAASGSPLPAWASGPIPLAIGGARLAYEQLTGQDQAQQPDPDQPPVKGPGTTAYETMRDRWRAVMERADRQEPVSAIAGRVTGAVLAPTGRAAAVQAPTLGARLVQGARQAAPVAAGMGGLAGVGEGTDIESRARKGAVGTAVGGTAGAVLGPVAGELGSAALRYGTQPVRRVLNRTLRPGREAENIVARDLRAGAREDPGAAARLTRGEFDADVAAGGHSRLVDLGGNPARRRLDTAAQLSPEGDTAVRQVLQHRSEGQTDRFIDWARHRGNFPNPRATERALERERRTVLGPAYRQAYSEGDRPIISPELETLLGSPHVARAVADAVEKGKSIAIAEGHGAFNPRVTISADGRVTFNKGDTGVPAYPNLQMWDYTKRALDGIVNKLYRDGADDEARVVSTLRTRLRDELDKQVPSYANARNSALEFFNASSASEAGAAFFGQGTKFGRLEDAREAIAGMNGLQRALFTDAYMAEFIHSLRNMPFDKRDVWKQIIKNRNARDEIDIAIGAERRGELEALTRLERIHQMPHTAVTGNSQTSRRRADIQAGIGAGAGGLTAAAGAYNQDANTTAVGAVVAALAGARRGNDRRIAERVARLYMSQDPRQVEHAYRLVAQNQRLMENLRHATGAPVTRGVPGQTTNLVGPQGTSASRAEDDEPVQRPGQQ